jgi:hypothetical protein
MMETDYPNLDNYLVELRTTSKETLGYFALPEEKLTKTYAPGKWTVRQLLHHLADAESVLYERIRRGIARPGQVVYGFDQDAWAEHLAYADRDLRRNQRMYQVIRENIIELAERYYESKGQQVYVHNETGLRTVKEEFDKVAWHNAHHLKQIRQALKAES